MLKRDAYGTYHHLSDKHLIRHTNAFAGRRNPRQHFTIDQMKHIVRNSSNKRPEVRLSGKLDTYLILPTPVHNYFRKSIAATQVSLSAGP